MDTDNIKLRHDTPMDKWRIVRLLSELSEIDDLEIKHSGGLEAEIGKNEIIEIKPIYGHKIYRLQFAGVAIDNGYFSHISIYDRDKEYKFKFKNSSN